MTAVLDYHQAMHDLFSALRPHLRDLSARLADWQLGANAALGALEPECKALIDRHKPYWNPTGPLLPPPSTTEAGAGNREIKQGYLFRRRMKGIGTPWKRVWAWIDAEGYFGTTAVGRERVTVTPLTCCTAILCLGREPSRQAIRSACSLLKPV